MTDITPNFDHIPRLQEIATTIREIGAIADIFDSPATAAYDIECAIKEIERLHRDYSCICNEMRRMMEERDEARREVCQYECRDDTDWMSGPFPMRDSTPRMFAQLRGWDCFKGEAK